MKNRMIAIVMAGMMAMGLAACGGGASGSVGTDLSAGTSSASAASEMAEVSAEDEAAAAESTAKAASEAGEEDTAAVPESADAEEKADGEQTEIQVFIAASLSTVMEDIAAKYQADHPDVSIVYNADSSGTLMTQIQEGYSCDIFFSAAQKQMNMLEEEGLLVDGTRRNVLNNQLVVVTRNDSGTAVTGLETLKDAASIAMADGSVPAGKYTRTALMNLGILPETETPEAYTTEEVQEALGGVEISEQSNVSKVLQAVAEASCEVGTTYYSDTYGYKDELTVLETVSYDLTGNIIYPIAMTVNEEADEAETAAAQEFLEYVCSDTCKAVFDAYYFDTNV